jgi:hypothetical protein
MNICSLQSHVNDIDGVMMGDREEQGPGVRIQESGVAAAF